MSNIIVEAVRVKEVNPHPAADRLEVARVMGVDVVVGKGAWKPGDMGIYFPPGILIPLDVSDAHGTTQYLKHATYPGEDSPRQCRVSACRLRGQPSYGYLVPVPEGDSFAEGTDLSLLYGAVKYEPPIKISADDQAPECEAFHKYTDIENLYRYPDAIAEGTPVRITEKIHGTNSRIGRVNGELMAGSHRIRLKQPEDFRKSRYWFPMLVPGVAELLEYMNDAGNVIVFGEIYGPGIQDLDYGHKTPGYRVFDISVNLRYLDFADMQSLCQRFGVEVVPVLHIGAYTTAAVESNLHGPTILADASKVKSKFKGREGVVITPLKETHSDVLGGRLILKAISADFHDRKGAEDNE